MVMYPQIQVLKFNLSVMNEDFHLFFPDAGLQNDLKFFSQLAQL